MRDLVFSDVPAGAVELPFVDLRSGKKVRIIAGGVLQQWSAEFGWRFVREATGDDLYRLIAIWKGEARDTVATLEMALRREADRTRQAGKRCLIHDEVDEFGAIDPVAEAELAARAIAEHQPTVWEVCEDRGLDYRKVTHSFGGNSCANVAYTTSAVATPSHLTLEDVARLYEKMKPKQFVCIHPDNLHWLGEMLGRRGCTLENLGVMKVSEYFPVTTREWEFPRDRFTTYEKNDEAWAIPLGFGRWVEKRWIAVLDMERLAEMNKKEAFSFHF